MYCKIDRVYALLLVIAAILGLDGWSICLAGERDMVDLQLTEKNLRKHLEALTHTIGERSVAKLWNLQEAAEYIEAYYQEVGVDVRREQYSYKQNDVFNIVAEPVVASQESKVFLLGAHYDSLKGTVGADDNGSAVAVQLEVARVLSQIQRREPLNLTVRCISFALEEPPAYGTWGMGSRVYAYKAKKTKERIDGMICLEMVGYTCREVGCQGYPFPLMFMGYPKIGNFIGIVGNYKSRKLTTALFRSFLQNKDLPVERVTIPGGGYLVPDVRLSDHASFWDRGYRAVMITDTAYFRNPHYHRFSDRMETLDYSFMSQLVKSLVQYFTSQGRE